MGSLRRRPPPACCRRFKVVSSDFLLYLQSRPVSLDEIARELDQSKGNISLNIRGLVDWHLVHRRDVPGSRKDHYEAATDLWR